MGWAIGLGTKYCTIFVVIVTVDDEDDTPLGDEQSPTEVSTSSPQQRQNKQPVRRIIIINA